MTSLTRARIQGFKSIKDLDLEFHKNNILIGENGAGKSNLVSFFTMLNYVQSEAMQEYVHDNGGANALLHCGSAKTPLLTASINIETDSGDNEYFFRLSVAAGDSLIFVDEATAFSRNDRDSKAPLRSLGAGHKESMLGESGSAGNTTSNVIYRLLKSFQVFRFINTGPNAFIKQPRYIQDNHYLKSDGGNLAALLYKIKTEDLHAYEDIVHAVRDVAPFFNDFVLEPGGTGETVLLRWTQKDSEVIFGPHHLSDGNLRFMALATLFLQPEPPQIIMVDEPELGLQPYSVRALAKIVKDSNSQVIFSTQSAFLVDHFSPNDVIVVEREGDVSSYERKKDKSLREWLDRYRNAV